MMFGKGRSSYNKIVLDVLLYKLHYASWWLRINIWPVRGFYIVLHLHRRNARRKYDKR